jgi:hypothetical protein
MWDNSGIASLRETHPGYISYAPNKAFAGITWMPFEPLTVCVTRRSAARLSTSCARFRRR